MNLHEYLKFFDFTFTQKEFVLFVYVASLVLISKGYIRVEYKAIWHGKLLLSANSKLFIILISHTVDLIQVLE